MAEFDICAYGHQAMHGAATGILTGNGTLTGHHIIPDHCFYYTSGLRGMGDLSGFLCPGIYGYTTMSAPVIIVSADFNGGKSRNHGLIHAIFDPVEEHAAKAGGNQWTYAAAKTAALHSLSISAFPNVPNVEAILDAYFKGQCGIGDDTMLRAGEHGTMASRPAPRSSGRTARNTAAGKYRSSPY